MIEADRTITYGDLAAAVLGTAGHLRALGVRPGDRVGLCLKDTAEHAIVALATGYVGAIGAPLDWRARAAENARIAGALALRLVAVEADGTLGPHVLCVAIDAAWHGAVSRTGSPGEAANDWDAPFMIGPSSGTTGPNKFTVVTHLQAYLRFAANSPVARSSRRTPSRALCTTPLFFDNGRATLFAHLLRGDTLVLHPALLSAADFVALVNRHAIDVAFVVPSMARGLLEIAGADRPLLPTIDALRTSGAPFYAAEMRKALRRLTPNFHQGYGTSAIGAISLLMPGDAVEHADSVGQILPLVESEIVDDDDRPLPPGAAGRLRCRGPTLGTPLPIAGQPNEPQPDIRGGWHYPGEMARLDERGYLYLAGRTADVIMRGGAKIHPAEVEAVLQEHPAVAEAAVVGQRAANNEEIPIAFVVRRSPVEAGVLLGLCRSRLTGYKIPSEIRFVASLPRNTAGKVDKPALVEDPALRTEGPRLD